MWLYPGQAGPHVAISTFLPVQYRPVRRVVICPSLNLAWLVWGGGGLTLPPPGLVTALLAGDRGGGGVQGGW